MAELSSDDIFEYILIPETALLLIRQDRQNCSPAEAFHTMIQSHDYGYAMFPALDNSDHVQRTIMRVRGEQVAAPVVSPQSREDSGDHPSSRRVESANHYDADAEVCWLCFENPDKTLIMPLRAAP